MLVSPKPYAFTKRQDFYFYFFLLGFGISGCAEKGMIWIHILYARQLSSHRNTSEFTSESDLGGMSCAIWWEGRIHDLTAFWNVVLLKLWSDWTKKKNTFFSFEAKLFCWKIFASHISDMLIWEFLSASRTASLYRWKQVELGAAALNQSP